MFIHTTCRSPVEPIVEMIQSPEDDDVVELFSCYCKVCEEEIYDEDLLDCIDSIKQLNEMVTL